MKQKLIDSANEWADKNASHSSVGDMAKPYIIAAFKAGAECLKKIQAENRAKIFNDFNLDSHESPTFIPFPKSQLKEMQEYEWQKYRMEVAKEYLVNMPFQRLCELSNLDGDTIEHAARESVQASNALIAELKKSEE